MSAFRVQGNLENALVLPKFNVTTLGDEVFRYLPERFESGDFLRPVPDSLPEWFAFRVEPPEDPKRPFFVADAISSPHPTFGIGSFVSETARAKLAAPLGDECAFLPVPVENAPEPFFAMWIRKVIPALDRSRAKVTELKYLPTKSGREHPLRIDRYAFLDDAIRGHYLFRLPGLDYSEESMRDFATSEFVDLTRDLNISGFNFFKGLTDPAFDAQLVR